MLNTVGVGEESEVEKLTLVPSSDDNVEAPSPIAVIDTLYVVFAVKPVICLPVE